jgi:hypothetical protein
VAEVLTDAAGFPRWWPEVYLGVTVTDRGDAEGIGRAVAVHSKGFLPYHLHWTGRLVEADLPHRWRITAAGDLTGEGEWRLEPTPEGTRAVYDWRVTADRPLFRLLSPLFGWLLAANHRWAMARGEAGLRRELARRRAAALESPRVSPVLPTQAQGRAVSGKGGSQAPGSRQGAWSE